ncbi:MAG TPA: DMT family transporter [Candidatus Paenalcaligenes intestinipullorum]|uniref:DMT family transporter n=1 Tax=Candidatus Paenalcaligenes intestinipullorum TaxID=2838718 RepID=A0A9D2RHI8_9BURK|nr:DMT family transporter [Candidatus Paenalcaligenes intestinipullorum]
MTPHRSAYTAAHVAAFLFGLTGILGAVIHASALFISWGRAGFALLCLAAVSRVTQQSLTRGLTSPKALVLALAGLFLGAHWLTFFLAVQVGGVGVATLGFASFPAFIAILDVLVFRDRIQIGEGVLLVLITLGLVLVTPSFELNNRGTQGLLWGLASGLAFALLAITNRRGARGIPSLQIAFWQNIVVAVLLLPWALSELTGLTLSDWGFLLLLGVLCTGIAQFLFVKSLEQLDARQAGVIIALEPVYAIAGAWWLFNEQPSARMIGGALLIIAASVASTRLSKRRAPSN